MAANSRTDPKLGEFFETFDRQLATLNQQLAQLKTSTATSEGHGAVDFGTLSADEISLIKTRREQLAVAAAAPDITQMSVGEIAKLKPEERSQAYAECARVLREGK
jgi:hypothetical protein